MKCLYNIPADAYVAIFHVSQVAKTTEEVYRLLDQRITSIRDQAQSLPEVKLHVDMLTFVPIYEYEVEKKIFSKKTYNEIPTGFELKKNLHIQYSDPEILNQLMEICSKAEVYDLVRVDYISTNMEKRK